MVSGKGLKSVRMAIRLRSVHSNLGPVNSDNFDDYWRVASKVTPTTIPARPQSPPPGAGSLHTRPPSVDPGTTASSPDKDGASSVRSVPVRVYLPDGPVLQELAPPLLDGGQYLTNCLSGPTDP